MLVIKGKWYYINRMIDCLKTTEYFKDKLTWQKHKIKLV